MYKVLIADDEAVVREGMRNNINWEEHGFELVADCENGNEAMDAVEKLRPDVVLTDICMPFVDGLQLTRFIMDKFPQTKVIILTGYDEFEYAQQAVKLRAYDFLLKPITASELRKILDKLKLDLDEEVKKREDINSLKRQLRESFPLLRERFLNRFVSGHLRRENIEEKLKYFGIDLQSNFYTVAVIDVDDYGEFGIFHPGTEDELLLFAVFNICEEIVGRDKNGIVFQNSNEKTFVILTGEDERSLNELAQRLMEEVRQSIEKYLKFTVTVGIGKACSSLREIPVSCKGAVSALDYRFLLGKNQTINITDMEGSSNSSISFRKDMEKRLISGIKTGTAAEVDELVSDIIRNLKSSCSSIHRCYTYIQQMIVSIINTIVELGMDESEIFGEAFNPFTDIYRFKTLGEIEHWMKELCRQITSYISEKRNDFSKEQAIKAEEYIRENYQDENISLNSVCKHLLISTSYFSLIFKNRTGETFIEYLTRIRVEKAKELLKTTTLKTYEIADKVGYKDPHYFSLIFKKATGAAPTEYREKVMGENA